MNEKLSTWMDGELDGEQARQLPTQIKRDAALRGNWDCYHLIGDAIRGVQGPDLCTRICARLDTEPTVLALRRRPAGKLRRYALSAAASVAAAAFVGWIALSGPKQDAPQLSAKAEPRQVAVPAGEGAKDYLLAHQRYSPSSVMQGVAPYVRTVADGRSVAHR